MGRNTRRTFKIINRRYYRNPSKNINSLDILFDSVLAAIKERDICFIGDFNIHISWDTNISGACTDQPDRWFFEHFVDGLGLFQHNVFPTKVILF